MHVSIAPVVPLQPNLIPTYYIFLYVFVDNENISSEMHSLFAQSTPLLTQAKLQVGKALQPGQNAYVKECCREPSPKRDMVGAISKVLQHQHHELKSGLRILS